MKNFAKILMLFFVIAALTGVFAFAAFAETETTEDWYKPDSDVFYAVWNSYEEYAAQAAPKATNKNATVTPAQADAKIIFQADLKSYGNCYIRLYNDCYLGAAPANGKSILNAKQNVVIDLNDKQITLGVATSISGESWGSMFIGEYAGTFNSSLTLQNGKVNSPNQTQINSSALIMKNVDITASQAFGYDSSGSFELYSCTWTNMTNNSYLLYIGNKGMNVKICDTDIRLNSVGASTGVFKVLNGVAGKNTNIYIDGQSSFVTESNSPTWVTVNNSQAVANLYIEKGFSFVTNAVSVVDGTPVFTTNSADYAKVNFVDDLDAETYTYLENVKLYSAGNGKVYVDGEKPIVLWTPAEGETVYYAAWESEFDYLSGLAPVVIGNDSAITSATVGKDSEYVINFVKLYKDCSSPNTGIKFGNKQTAITIDLSNCAYTVNGEFAIGDGNYNANDNPSLHCHFTIKNGTVNMKNRFYPSPYVTMTLEKITMNVEHQYILHDSGSDTRNSSYDHFFHVKDSTINIKNGNAQLYLHTRRDGDALSVLFENTDIVYKVTPIKPLIRINQADTKATVRFDKDCSITGGAFDWVSVVDNNKYVTNVILEKGILLDLGAANKIASTEDYTMSVVNPGETTPLTAFDKVDVGYGNIVLANGADNYVIGDDVYYAVWPSLSAVEYGLAPSMVFKADTIIDTDFNTWGNCYVKLYKNVKFTTNSNYLAKNQNAVVDLNNCMATLQYFKVGKYNTKDYYCSIKFTNGEVVLSGQNQHQCGATVTFDKVILTGSTIGYGSGASMYFNECDITLSYAAPFSLGDTYGEQIIKFTKTTLNLTSASLGYASSGRFGGIFGVVQSITGWDGSSTVIIDSESKFLTNDAASNVPWIGFYQRLGTHSGLNVYIEEGATVSNNIATNFKTIVAYSETSGTAKFEDDPNGVAGSVLVVSKGTTTELEGWSAIDNGNGTSTYGVYVAPEKPNVPADALQANLTLYTDFVLNFHADPAYIKGITYNGAALEGVAVNGKVVYSVLGINPTEAAKALTFTILFEGGATYDLTYSVLTYANTVVDNASGVSALGKQLVSAAMAYVQAACAYADVTVPAFTGVAVTKAEAPATTAPTLPAVLSAAQLELDDSFKFIFKLTAGQSANITVAGSAYEVIDGKVGTADYIVVEVRAYELYNNGVVITDANGTYVYTLANYVNYAKTQSNAELTTLVEALYTYAYYASSYKVSNPNLD